jgi:hypothetical protein
LNPLRWAKAEVLHIAWRHGRYLPPDRKIFQEEILPALATEPGTTRVLSVGVAWYTQSYAEIFAGKTFTTIDLDETRAAVAGPSHLVGDLRDLERLVDASEPFDVILMNGVIGFGLNHAPDVDAALRAGAARLRPGGTLVLGINEEKPTHVDPSSVEAHELFESRSLGRFTDGRVTVAVPFRERSHTFLFWRKR